MSWTYGDAWTDSRFFSRIRILAPSSVLLSRCDACFRFCTPAVHTLLFVQVVALLSYVLAYFPGGVQTLRFGGSMALRGAGSLLPF